MKFKNYLATKSCVHRDKMIKLNLFTFINVQYLDYLIIVSRHPCQQDKCSPIMTKMGYNESPHRSLRQNFLPWYAGDWFF